MYSYYMLHAITTHTYHWPKCDRERQKQENSTKNFSRWPCHWTLNEVNLYTSLKKEENCDTLFKLYFFLNIFLLSFDGDETVMGDGYMVYTSVWFQSFYSLNGLFLLKKEKRKKNKSLNSVSYTIRATTECEEFVVNVYGRFIKISVR